MIEMTLLADDLVDPTAQRTEQRERAPRLAPSSAVTVGLVDGTLNKASLWGQGMLDAAERALSPALTAATFDRISLNPLNQNVAVTSHNSRQIRCVSFVPLK